jgi:predicted nucleic acid-binding protein
VIVLDASAAVELLLTTDVGDRVADRLIEEAIHAPHLITVEVTHAMRRAVQLGATSPFRARAVLRDLVALEVVKYGHDDLIGRALALRDNLTAYDAVYIALAELLDSPVVTCDGRLARSRGHRAQIELIT